MFTYVAFVMCLFVGQNIAYYQQREVAYNPEPIDPYTAFVSSNSVQEPSQRLFWSNQGSNQVGGTGLWAHLTNKFPFLGNMFGRMQLSTEYGVPNQYNVPSTQYGVPEVNRVQYYPQQPQFYQQPQLYQQPQFQNQVPQQFGQRFVPSARDVGVTDDAIIVTPPFVPPVPPVAQPAPIPAPVPVPAPVLIPAQEQGYTYNKPQYRLELPHK